MPANERTRPQRISAENQRRARQVWIDHGKPGIVKMAELTGVSSSTISRWRKRWREDEAANVLIPSPMARNQKRAQAKPERVTSSAASVIDPDADALSNLAKMRAPALAGLESVLMHPDTSPSTRLAAAKHSLALAGVVPPSRGSTQIGDSCEVCDARAEIRAVLSPWSVDQLEALAALLEGVTGGD